MSLRQRIRAGPVITRADDAPARAKALGLSKPARTCVGVIGPYWGVPRNPRVWIYLVVGVVAAGLIGYSEWRDSDAQRLQRCIDASMAQMKEQTPVLAEFDNAQLALVEMSRASCARQLGIDVQTR